MKTNPKISEYTVVKRVITKDEDDNIIENSYYILRNTLVKYDGYTYTDLCTNKPIKMFNFQEFDHNDIGIMLEKDQTYYENQVQNICAIYNNKVMNLILELKEILKNQEHHYAGALKKYLYYVAKSLDSKKIVALQTLKTNFKPANEDRKKIYELLKDIKNENTYYFKIFLHYSINAKILADLNNPVRNRINPQKSIMLYEEENGLIKKTEENWQELNSYKSANNNNNIVVPKRRKRIFGNLFAKI